MRLNECVHKKKRAFYKALFVSKAKFKKSNFDDLLVQATVRPLEAKDVNSF